MKSFTSAGYLALLCLVFLSHIHHAIAGSDLAHGAERVLEYLDYLAEEEYDPGNGKSRQFTVSPNCKGSRAGGRCTLAEFLLYNWKGNSKTLPKGYSTWPSIATDPTTHGLKDLTDKVVAARFDIKSKKGAHFKPISNIEPSKLFPSNPQLDYFDLLGNKGSKISQLKLSRTNLNDYQNRLVSRAGEAAQSILELRVEDNEKFWLKFLGDNLSFKVSTKPYTIKPFGRTFQIFDLAQTLKNGPKTALNDIVSAKKKWLSSDKAALSHATAIRKARVSMAKVACRLPRL